MIRNIFHWRPKSGCRYSSTCTSKREKSFPVIHDNAFYMLSWAFLLQSGVEKYHIEWQRLVKTALLEVFKTWQLSPNKPFLTKQLPLL